MRSVQPWFFMKSVGLGAFVAMIGLKADQSSYTLSRNRLRPFWGGIVVTLTPLISDLFFDRYILRLNPAPNGRTRRRANDDSPAWQPCRRNQTAQWPRSVIRTLQHSATFS